MSISDKELQIQFKKVMNQLSKPLNARGGEDGCGEKMTYKDPHWVYCADRYEQQFQAINCTKCGEYKYTARIQPLSHHSRCKCNQ
jgi:hypothetical protein